MSGSWEGRFLWRRQKRRAAKPWTIPWQDATASANAISMLQLLASSNSFYSCVN